MGNSNVHVYYSGEDEGRNNVHVFYTEEDETKHLKSPKWPKGWPKGWMEVYSGFTKRSGEPVGLYEYQYQYSGPYKSKKQMIQYLKNFFNLLKQKGFVKRFRVFGGGFKEFVCDENKGTCTIKRKPRTFYSWLRTTLKNNFS